MRILVTFAVEAEFAPWRKRHDFIRQEIEVAQQPANQRFYKVYEADISGIEIDVLLTGIGWEDLFYNTARKVLHELLKRKPDCCISTGLAGGLDAELDPGEIVAATQLTLRQGGSRILSNKKLLKAAEKSGARIVDTLITENHIVGEASSKAAMSKFGEFVDMESYHILHIVTGTQIPAIAVRAISDAADRDLPVDFNKLLGRDGLVKKRRLIAEIAHNPLKIPGLVRFGWQSKKAARALADFLDNFIATIEDFDGRISASAYGEVAAR